MIGFLFLIFPHHLIRPSVFIHGLWRLSAFDIHKSCLRSLMKELLHSPTLVFAFTDKRDSMVCRLASYYGPLRSSPQPVFLITPAMDQGGLKFRLFVLHGSTSVASHSPSSLDFMY